MNKVYTQLKIRQGSLPDWPAKIVTPGTESFIVTGGIEELESMLAVWGFPGKGGGLVINARSESVLARPMFSGSFENRRCVLPAESFWEWDYNKNKVEFTAEDRELFYLAGFWKSFPDSLRFVVLTTEANESMLSVHDRMPLFMDAEDVEPYLYNNNDAKRILTRKMPPLEQKRELQQLSIFDL